MEHTLHDDPMHMIALLASACAITFIIALVNDSLAVRKKTAEARNPSSRPKP